MKTYVFFPTEAGLAHVTRSLAIAQELERRGARIVFAVGKEKHDLVRQSGFRPIKAATALPDGFDTSSLLRWQNETFVHAVAKEDYEIIKKYHPDCVVVDFRPPTIAACLAAGVPTAYVTGSGGFPYGCWIPGFGLPTTIHRMLVPVLQRYIWRQELPFFQTMIAVAKSLGADASLEETLHRIRFIVPEVSSYLPSVDTTLNVSYVGPIFWDQFGAYRPGWLDRLHPDGKTVYVSFGGTGFDREKLVVLASTLAQQGYRVVVSASTIASVGAFPKHPNLFVTSYLDGLEACHRADIVVCHGGYGTIMQAAIAGKPVVAIPFNPDQLLHSLRWQELGLGMCLVDLKFSTFFPFRWEKIMTLGSTFSNDRILRAVASVLSRRKDYNVSIHGFTRMLPKRSGAALAADAIEEVTN